MIEGYEIGGKTGTAEKLPRGNGKYILSFIGFSPVKDPQVVIYCVVDEPESDNQAATAAGTLLFNQIAEDLLPYIDAKLQVNKDYSDTFAFRQKCFMNTANAGMFSSDRTINQYARELWKVKD